MSIDPPLFRTTIKSMIILTNFSLVHATNLKKPLRTNEIYFKIYLILKLILLILVIWAYSRILFVHYKVWPTIVANVVRQLNFGMMHYCYVCIWIHSLKKNSKYNELIETLKEFDENIKLENTYYRTTRRQIYLFIVFIITTYICIAIERTFSIMKSSKYFYYPYEFYIVYCIPLFAIAVNLLNFLVFVTIVKVRLEYIKENLKMTITLNLLRNMCSLHMKLNDIVLLTNEVFGVNLIAIMAVFFVQFLSGSYTIVFSFLMSTGISDMLQLLLTSAVFNCPYLFLLWWICYCSRRTVQEVI